MILIFLILIGTEAHNITSTSYRLVKGSIQGQLPTEGFLQETNTRGKIGCAKTCAGNQNCMAMVYVTDTQTCQVHRQTIDTIPSTHLVPNPSAVYYEIDRYVSTTPLTTSTSTSSVFDGVVCSSVTSTFRTWTVDGVSFQFRVFNDANRTFADASNLCNDHGGTLFRVLTEGKMTFVLELLSCPSYDSSSFWANGILFNGVWQTIEGEPLGMTAHYWAPARPNGGVSTPCLWLPPYLDHYLDDQVCEFETYAICEI